MQAQSNNCLNNILREITLGTRLLYEDKLKKIILYGSYARGNNNEDSDIDLMILIDEDEEKLKQYEKQLDYLISEIGYKYIKVLSLVDISHKRYNEWVDIVPYYKNVKNEGVVIYEQ